jgi:anthranilate/para-aminobenzoate synthase component I
MITTQHQTATNNFTAVQKKALQRFKKKLAQELPALRVAWAQPYSDTIIDLHLEYDKRTYRKSVKAAKLAIEAGEETGVMIILR